MQKVLVTGATSFLGLEVVRRLSNTHEVVGLTSTVNSINLIKNEKRKKFLSENVRLIEVDLLDLNKLEAVIKNFKPNYIVHVAGDTTRYAEPDYDLKKSLTLHYDPLEIFYRVGSENGCSGIILTGSSAEYSESLSEHKENEDCFPQTPYGISKLIQTKTGFLLGSRYNIPTRVVRVFNIFGALENENKLIPSIITTLKNKKPFPLSHGNQERSFSHVSTVAELYEALLQTMPESKFEIVNSGLSKEVTLKNLLTSLADVFGYDSGLLKFGEKEMRATESLKCIASIEKSSRYLGKKLSVVEELEKLRNEFYE